MSENYIKIELPDDYEVPDQLIGLSPEEWAAIFENASRPAQRPKQAKPAKQASQQAEQAKQASQQAEQAKQASQPVSQQAEQASQPVSQQAKQAEQANLAGFCEGAAASPTVDIIEQPELLVCVIC